MMTNDSRNSEDQKTTIIRLLNDEQVLVHINPQQAGVELPHHLMQNRSVTLRLSRYFRGRLTTDDDKVSAELLFGADYFTCLIPWVAIWGASSASGDEFVWSAAAPSHVVDVVMSDRNRGLKEEASKSAKHASAERKLGHLRRVK